MRIPDSFTLHQQARRARSAEMGRLACAALAAMHEWLRRKFTAMEAARTRFVDPA